MHYIVGAIIGYLAGVVTPGFIQKVRGEAKKSITIVDAEVAAAKADTKKL